MSRSEPIYLYTGGLEPEDVAARIAAAIGGKVSHDRGAVIVSRPMASSTEGGVGGVVGPNIFYENPPSTAHHSVIDLYDISYDVWCHPGAATYQETEAESIFAAIIEKLDWPAILTHADGDRLAAAWAPTLGRTDFPPGTTPDPEHEQLWQPYADPAQLLASRG